jgi:uncharacterized protein YjbI with pentapeptide repeats
LSGADLREADLRGANLSSAKNLTQAQLRQACGNSDTKLLEDLKGFTLMPCPTH